jgi:hypothetical protein
LAFTRKGDNEPGSAGDVEEGNTVTTETELPQSFRYEQCDVPDGVSLAEWRTSAARSHRKAQVAGGLLAALATLGPIAISVRSRRR